MGGQPLLEAVSDEPWAGARAVTVRLRSSRGADAMDLVLPRSQLEGLTVVGQALAQTQPRQVHAQQQLQSRIAVAIDEKTGQDVRGLGQAGGVDPLRAVQRAVQIVLAQLAVEPAQRGGGDAAP